MRMGNTLGVWLALSAASPVWAQGAPRDPKPDADAEKEETKAYYLISRAGEDVGWFSTEVGQDERTRTKIVRTQQAPQDAILHIGAILPSGTKEREGLQIEVQRTMILSDDRKLVEDHLKVISALDDFQLDGKYENGRWITDVRAQGAQAKSIRSPESPPHDPPLLDFLYFLVKSKTLQLGVTLQYVVYDLDPTGAPGRLAFKGTAVEEGSRPRFDGTDTGYLMVEAVFGAEDRAVKIFLTKDDGFLDEMAIGDLTYKRVTREALGSIAGWSANNRRDVFDSRLAVKESGETSVEDVVKPDKNTEDIRREIDKIREDTALVAAAGDDILKKVELVQALLVRVRRIRERKEFEKMAALQTDLNALEQKIQELLPRISLVYLAEARIIADEILDILGKDTPDAVLKAEKKYGELQEIGRRPEMIGSEEAPALKELTKEANFAIGRAVLSKYIEEYEVRGLIYRREDAPDEVRFGGTLLGMPVVLDESVHVLRPRGFCLIFKKKGWVQKSPTGKILKVVNVKSFREGEILDPTAEVLIQIKAVQIDKVILEGRGAEVELKYPPPVEK